VPWQPPSLGTSPPRRPAGERDGTWRVALPAQEVPPQLPEPCVGINYARDGMAQKDWLALIALHSDSWLVAVAYFYAVKLTGTSRCVWLTLWLRGSCRSHPVLPGGGCAAEPGGAGGACAPTNAMHAVIMCAGSSCSP